MTASDKYILLIYHYFSYMKPENVQTVLDMPDIFKNDFDKYDSLDNKSEDEKMKLLLV